MVQHNSELSLVDGVKSKQHIDPLLMELKEKILSKSIESFSQGEDCVLRNQGKLCVSYMNGLREFIMDKAHGSRYSIHLGATKMYHDLVETYWWNGIERE